MSRLSAKKKYEKLEAPKESTAKSVADILNKSLLNCCILDSIDQETEYGTSNTNSISLSNTQETKNCEQQKSCSLRQKRSSKKSSATSITGRKLSETATVACNPSETTIFDLKPNEADEIRCVSAVELDLSSTNEPGSDNSKKQLVRSDSKTRSVKRRNALILTGYS